MEFFEAIRRRRSVRKYTDQAVPPEVIEKAVSAAVLAPNSSNMQTWRIYWIRDPAKKAELTKACLNQSAARTAKELLVFTADASLWKESRKALLEHFGPGISKDLKIYYGKLIPFLYGRRILAPIKWLIFNLTGLFRPMTRGPWSARDVDEVCIKSAALACENFMLAIAAQGFDTCPMEGMDEKRVARLLGIGGLGSRARVVMVISVGARDENGIWGAQFRLPLDTVFQKI